MPIFTARVHLFSRGLSLNQRKVQKSKAVNSFKTIYTSFLSRARLVVYLECIKYSDGPLTFHDIYTVRENVFQHMVEIKPKSSLQIQSDNENYPLVLRARFTRNYSTD